jgi:hypothetical protein
MPRLRRWLLSSESVADSVIGGVIYGALIVVVFRFLFGDSWRFAVVSGIVLGIASFGLSEWSRRRRPVAREPGDTPE